MQKLPADVIRAHKGISFVGITTCFFCHDGQGNFFMAKRSQKARDEQGTWEVGGGGLKWGIPAHENMLREVKEEYNATILDSEFIGYWDAFRTLPDGTKTHWLALAYGVLVDPSSMKINEPDMFDDCGWFTFESLPSPLHSQQMPFFTQYGEQLREILSRTRED